MLLAEWEKQSAILMSWPQPKNGWSDVTAIEQTFLKIATEISQRQKLIINVCNDEEQKRIQNLLPPVQLNVIPTNDIWIRDYGPLSSKNALYNFQFNAWGGKYPFDLDNAVNHQLNLKPMIDVDFILEGGSIDTNGQGVLLTTEKCLRSPARNPQYTQTDIENLLEKTLEIKKIIWLKSGYLAGDDTDSHVDMLARFVNENTITYVCCSDINDEHYTALKAMEDELKATGYQLIPLPWPSAKYNAAGDRLPASYANFLILNEAVLLPIYDDPNDQLAIQQLTLCFPNREIVPINALALIDQFGSIHCATMQVSL